jgi:hypothetical protein
MSDAPQTPGQRRDALLLRLLKTPPQPRPKRGLSKQKTGKKAKRALEAPGKAS